MAVLAIVLVSGAVAALVVARLAKVSRAKSGLLAAALPQIGEFSFVLAGLGVSLKVMSPSTQSLIVAAAISSIMINPLLPWFADRAAGDQSRKPPQETRPGAPASPPPASRTPR